MIAALLCAAALAVTPVESPADQPEGWPRTFSTDAVVSLVPETAESLRVLSVSPSAELPAADLCVALAREGTACASLALKKKHAKLDEAELVASHPADQVWVLRDAGIPDTLVVSVYGSDASRLDRFLAVSGEPPRTDHVTARMSTLEERMLVLEDRVQQVMDPKAVEEKATNLYRSAQADVARFAYAEARTKLIEVTRRFPNARINASAQKMYKELDVVGRGWKKPEVQRWYQGESLVKADSPTLLVFWETWCGPCKKEMPKTEQRWRKYKDDGLVVLGLTRVTKSSNDGRVEAYLRDNNVTFAMARDKDSTMSQHYGVSGIPAAAMVLDGKVVWRGHPARLTDEMLETWLSP